MSHLAGICPACGASAPLECFLEDAAARALLASALALWPEPLRAGVPRYLGLFAPPKKRMALSKLQRVLAELVDLVRSGSVTRGGEVRPAPALAWGEGVLEVLAMQEQGTLQVPLGGHGLLSEIVHRRAGTRAAQAQAAVRPLHPSQRPADLPAASAPPAAEAWREARRQGRQHIGTLLEEVRRHQGG